MFIIISAVDIFARVLYFLIFIRCIISWFPIGRNNAVIQLLYTLTEPILAPIRKLIEKSPLGGPGMMVDFSPIVAFLLISVISGILSDVLKQML